MWIQPPILSTSHFYAAPKHSQPSLRNGNKTCGKNTHLSVKTPGSLSPVNDRLPQLQDLNERPVKFTATKSVVAPILLRKTRGAQLSPRYGSRQRVPQGYRVYKAPTVARPLLTSNYHPKGLSSCLNRHVHRARIYKCVCVGI